MSGPYPVQERLYSYADHADGTHSLSSPSHISLLFSKTFNVSIPLQHIPVETFEFEHTAPEEDAGSDSEDELDLNGGGVEEVGRWKRKDDGKLLGEGGKAVKFTVIGYVPFPPLGPIVTDANEAGCK